MKDFLQDLKEIVIFAITVLVVLVPLRLFVAQPFVVIGNSMQPTFESGEYLIVDELSYRIHPPSRGDVVIFKFPDPDPTNPKKYFIKRIVGLPGEKLVLTGEKITIYNDEHPEGFELDQSYIAYQRPTEQTVQLDDSHYFVMGDNREVSLDSRSWGPLPKENIVGRAFARLLPVNRIGVLPGNHNQN